MITLFPIAFWSDENQGERSGTSWFFVCTATRSHPYAAAIMAQEIYESRYKSIRVLAVAGALLAIGAGIAWGMGRTPSGLDVAAVSVFAIALGMIFTGLYAPWQQELELRGQMAECIVREGLYHHALSTAVDEAADQLTRYDQFKGWGKDLLVEELNKRERIAGDWCQANQHMIKRAKKEAGQ